MHCAILSAILSGIQSDILSGMYSDILSGIYSNTLSGILCGIYPQKSFGQTLCDRYPGILSGIPSGSIGHVFRHVSGILLDLAKNMAFFLAFCWACILAPLLLAFGMYSDMFSGKAYFLIREPPSPGRSRPLILYLSEGGTSLECSVCCAR